MEDVSHVFVIPDDVVEYAIMESVEGVDQEQSQPTILVEEELVQEFQDFDPFFGEQVSAGRDVQEHGVHALKA
ncbi:hypothetical protein L2E82_27876 [Cichorium intybus]|uniref:Uncharacterized protein n=1 Tax=Cichorium intybus TaxID=13427 RepID=A0ACB9CUV4_CICIN|nr:hypothetical protein L2E82_27876 [Cichorium intybus]